MGEFTWAYINGALTASGPTGSIQFRGDDEGCFATLSGSPNLRYLTGSQPEHGGNEVGILELTGNLNISGNLNIAGSFTTISSSNLVVQDPILGLAFGSASHASSVTGGVGDRGFVFGLNGNLNQALIWDQSSGSFVIGKVGSHGPDKTAYDVPFDNFSTFRAGVFQAVGNASQAKPTLSVIHLEDTNDAVEIIADAVTTADVMDVTADGLTTGKILKLVSDASSTGTRDLVFIHNDNTAAVNTTVLNIKNDAIAANKTVTIETTAAETNPLLELKNSNAATDKPPILSLNRSSASEADDMSLGRIEFNGIQSGDDSISYVTIDGFASDVTSGDEGGKLVFNVMAGGSAADADSKNLLSIGGEDQTGGQQCEVVVNEDGIDCDFRVEGDSETHLIFAEAENDRVSIGASVDSPVATLEVTNASDGGVPLLQLNSNDTDKIALDVNAANIDANVLDITADAVTTANVINVSADALSTGIGLHIDDNSSHTGDHHVVEIKQSSAAAVGATALAVSSSGGKIGMVLSKTYSNTSAASVTGLILDFDKTGASTSNNTLIGAQIDMDNATATDGTNQMVGIQVTPTLTHANDAGTTTVTGAEIIATGHTNGTSNTEGVAVRAESAAKNVGIKIVATDHAVATIDKDHADLIIASSADEDDHFSITVGTAGATTIRTEEDAAAAANLLFEVDGNISASANHGANPFQIQASKLKLLNTPLSSSEDVAGASLTTSGRLCVSGSAELEGDVTVSGSLTVLGTTTSVSSSNVIIKDPIIGLGFGTASANTGAVGDRGFVFGLGGNVNQALIWDQSSASFVLGKVGAIGPDRTAYDVPFPDLSTLRLGSLEFLSNISGSGEIFADSIKTSGDLAVSGNVGIGTSTPDYELDVAGNIGIGAEGGAAALLRSNGDSNTYIRFTAGGDGIDYLVGAVKAMAWDPSKTHVNPQNADHDFRVDTSGSDGSQDNSLFVEGSSGNVGIGTATPDNLLTVVGGHISSEKGLKTGTAHFQWSGRTAAFANGVDDLVAYLTFGDHSTWGWIEVTVTDGHNNARCTGKYTKRYQIGRNASTAINHQLSEVPASIGAVADEFKLGDFEVDSNILRIPIYRVTTSGNYLTVFVEGELTLATDNVDGILGDLALTSPAEVSNSETRDYYSIMSDRVGIGTAAPTALLHAVNGSSGGHPAVLIDNDDTDEIALDINAANISEPVVDILASAITTANIINITTNDSLTTGKVIAIDHNDAATTAVGPVGISYDFDKDGAMGNGSVAAYTGLDIDMHDAASNHAGSIVYMKGIDIDIGSTEADGTIINIGIDISGSGGDYNIGLKTLMDDAAGSPDIVMSSSINNNDYGTISVGANGAMTVTTTDQSAADADLTFTVDGDISLAANGGSNTFQLQSNNFAVTEAGDAEVLRSVGVGVPFSASLGMNVHHNPTSLKLGTGGGEVVAFGTESPLGANALVAGYLYCMQDDGAWCLADADLVASSSALLGIALGGEVQDGILLRGYFHMASASVSDHHLIGQPCYISEDAGHIDWIAPSAAGDTVRVIGYGTPVANLIYFNPDNTWIELP